MDVLETILTAKKKRVEESKNLRSPEMLESMAKKRRGRDFYGAVSRPGKLNLICEMKRKSPSAGLIREPFNPGEIAIAYQAGGASALSVLTEEDHFAGSLDDLATAKLACSLPVLRKDFIFDPYQILESRAYGADAVLLIAEALTPKTLKTLADEVFRLGMEPLVEIFSEDSLPAALNSGSRLIGVNSRNLRTLEMNPDNFFYLSRLAPKDRLLIAESGIQTREQAEKAAVAGAKAALVGESLLKKPDLKAAVAELVVER